jgi:hypothetical protein
MRRDLLTAPFAFLSSACVMPPWTTPSTSVAYRAEPPRTEDAVSIAQPDAMALWQLPPNNPWQPYEKLTLLTAVDSLPSTLVLPHVADLEAVQAARRAAEVVAAVGLPPDTMWVVDVRGPASVAFGSTLTRRGRQSVTPVLTFNNWPADSEMIPAEESLSALLTMPPSLPTGPGPTLPVFLLDAWRLAYRDETVHDDVTDNRYMLNPADLPSAEVLVERGIRHVLYVVEDLDDTQTEEDDLNETFLKYQAEGVRVSMVDFTWLMELGDRGSWRSQATWDWRLGSSVYTVGHRATIVKDPNFYVRARGGFGGEGVLPPGRDTWAIHGLGFWVRGGGGHGGG